MGRQLTPAEVRTLAETRRVAQDPACHIRDRGLRLQDVILALANCFRVHSDARPHQSAAAVANAYRADCHYIRGQRLRVDFHLAAAADGDIILVVTAFILEP